jgi:threonine aldolase
MQFLSDNVASVHHKVLDAVLAANQADAGYDNDAISKSLNAAFSDLFETSVQAFWIATGTAANGLALAGLCPPFGGIVCHGDAHIQNDECGAPEFYTHGAKLLLADGEHAKLTPRSIQERTARIKGDVHWVQPHAVSITNATEYGCAYTPAETGAIGELCREKGWGLHVDGARFANAVAHLGVHPAELTWRAGVSVLSFGFVKNGGMNAEAIVFFNAEQASGFAQRRKRAGHLQSKGRFAAAQLIAMLKDDLWITNARQANAGAAQIAKAGARFLACPVEANEVFLNITPDQAQRLRQLGFSFYDWAPGQARFVVSWDQSSHEIDQLCAALGDL